MTEGFDLSHPRRVHVIGVGGAGMSAIATVLVAQGHTVSGSDAAESRTLERLRDLGIAVMVGHRPEHLPADLDAVMVSTAIAADNPEVALARERGVPVLSRAAGLTALTAQRRTAAVAGSHGKTTTASMLASILRDADLDPSFVIGGDLTALGTNAAWGSADLFVVEADESDGTFLELAVDATIITNIEPDHLEHWGGFDAVIRGFDTYADGISGAVVICADEANAARIIASRRADDRPTIAYGFAPDADVAIVDYEPGGRSSTFTLQTTTGPIGPITLPSPGRHNASNAAGAAALALELGATPDAIVRALAQFGGVARRFQYRGVADGVTFIDDYAHLPSEVEAAISAAQDGDWARVVVVFQPHRYSRTEALWSEFADAFVAADVLYLTDVYAAGETPRPGVDGHLIVEAVLDAHPETALTYLPRRAELLSVLRTRVRPGDLVLTLGAGDLTTLPDDWPVSC